MPVPTQLPIAARQTFPALALFLGACGRPEPADPAAVLEDVPQRASWSLPIEHPAYIVFTEGEVPHIFAHDRRDLAVVWGFQVARDRYFMMDLSRRLALGELSEVLGRDALSADLESRAQGNRHIAERLLALTEAHHPDILAWMDGYAEGVNAYIAQVKAGVLPPPSEYALVAGTLGAEDPSDLMEPFDRLDVAAGVATVLAMSGFEGGDVGRGSTEPRLDGWYRDFDHAVLRQAGLRPEIWDPVLPVFPVASAPGWDPASHPRAQKSRSKGKVPAVPADMVERIQARRARWDRLLGHDWESGWGSNAWAVHADGTVDGRSLLAGDGHLGLTIPPLFYQIGLDTSLLGEDNWRFAGMTVPGLPVPGPGTNNHTAWSQIAFFGDVTDWYREEVRLGADGKPEATRFQGAWKPVVAASESYTIRDVPLLDSVGGEESWVRYTTFDGRWIADIEGDRVNADHPGPVVRMGADFVVPRDIDGDGSITAISFDYAPLDGTPALAALWAMADARDVDAFRAATRDLVGNSAGLIVSDRAGDILYTGFQAVPCRTYLPRSGDGGFVDGANPRLLLDGTQYPGFTTPFTTDGHVDLAPQADPTRCVVPMDGYPWEKNPASRFLVAANNDPGGQTFDDDLTNDGWYVGGPWLEGYRADTISRELGALVSTSSASVGAMKKLQANHDSRLGEQLLPYLREAAAKARAVPADEVDPERRRLRERWVADEARLEEALRRLDAWADAGFQARSGVETFYDPVLEGDVDDSVATMIFNAWYGRFLRAVLDDENIPPGAFQPTGDSGRMRLMMLILEHRGDRADLASVHPDTDESIYFDVQGTPELETSDELMIRALTDALDFLEGPPVKPGEGGFGTTDMDAWRWGYRHWVRFDSVLAEFLGDDPAFGALTAPFSINPSRFPVAQGLAPGDPRGKLPGFPRHGDHLNVDAGNSGSNGERFSYGSGPVFRLVVALGPEGAEAHNVLPGGQSGLTDSAFFDDQAKKWLANEAMVVPTDTAGVVRLGVARERFLPSTP